MSLGERTVCEIISIKHDNEVDVGFCSGGKNGVGLQEMMGCISTY